jgi:hypothetical protein
LTTHSGSAGLRHIQHSVICSHCFNSSTRGLAPPFCITTPLIAAVTLFQLKSSRTWCSGDPSSGEARGSISSSAKTGGALPGGRAPRFF